MVFARANGMPEKKEKNQKNIPEGGLTNPIKYV